jgi:hypothetical protein
MKLWALISESCCAGENDYTDILLIPDYMDPKIMKYNWNLWYRECYCSDGALHHEGIKYLSFIDYLKGSGAKDPSDSDIQFFRY